MSSFVSACPDLLASASQSLSGIGSAIKSANAAAAVSTTEVAVAAQDEVSTAIAALFRAHGQQYQALGASAAAFHDQFASTLLSGGNSYAATEAANAPSLQADEGALVADAERLSTRVETRVEREITALTMLNPTDLNRMLSALGRR